jgi:hypothetical protein
MNGRVYDPMIGRFLSPDPYVQAPDYSQNFNRYSYALNNPLKFTDPSGEIPLVAAIAYIAMQGIIAGDMARDTEMGFWGGFALGAGTALVSPAVGPIVGSVINGPGAFAGIVNGMTHAAISGAITYGATAMITGEPINFKSYLTNIAVAGAYGGIMGGIDAYNYNHLVGPRPYGEPGNASIFWGFYSRSSEVIYDGGFPYVHQSGKENCCPAIGESASRGKTTQKKLRDEFGGNPDVDGIGDGYLWLEWSEQTGYKHEMVIGAVPTESIVDDVLNAGNSVAVTLDEWSGHGVHGVLINRVTRITKRNFRGITKTWLKYNVMDPKKGQYVPISNWELDRSLNYFILYNK